jgi:serine/threonine protein kinase
MKLRSPYVVELVEVLTIQNHKNTTQQQQDENVKYATVMECLDETLGSVIRNARRNKRRATSVHVIIKEITECLGWCHSRGIAFCDLKPSNIMHNRRIGHWKLIDFEASRTIGEELVGVITPRYCPPEVARATTYGLEGANGVVATASVDMWALGCVLYELETNTPLFPNNITDSTILHFISHPSSSTPALNNGLRWNDESELEIPGLDNLIQDDHSRTLIRTLLSREPAKRSDVASVLVSLQCLDSLLSKQRY